MLKKWKQRALELDYKKSAVRLILIGILWFVFSIALIFANFHGRAESLKTEFAKMNTKVLTEQENEKQTLFSAGRSGEKGSEKTEQLRELDFSVADIVLVAAAGVIGLLLFAGYWILVAMWTYARADRLGTNRSLWTAAALLFNLVGAAALWCYGTFAETCKDCGRIRRRGEVYCSRCGQPFRIKCAHCGQETEPGAGYCGHCGEKMEA